MNNEIYNEVFDAPLGVPCSDVWFNASLFCYEKNCIHTNNSIYRWIDDSLYFV